MAASFFFYDLETSGISPRSARVMQFAGQRTDMKLKPVGEPFNFLIKLTPDALPEPDAVLVTGITPQATVADGITEAEFLKIFYEQIALPDTTFLGYNSVRFDDEFMRFLHYRNFYDAYEWQWCDGCSRWDLLDVVRMTRALRPDDIEWPFAPDGKPTNRLESLTKVNRLDHTNAHDALSDVNATVAIAKLIRSKQKDLFEYLFAMRTKNKVKELVLKAEPFVYSSGRYPGATLHTTAAVLLAKHPGQDAALVYDLRHNPEPFINMNAKELLEAWRFSKDKDKQRLPVKTLKYNRCPAVAPLGVMNNEATEERLQLKVADVKRHLAILKKHHAKLAKNVIAALQQLDKERQTQTALIGDVQTVDARLYDSFFGKKDVGVMQAIRVAEPTELEQFESQLQDDRLKSLLSLYKARNFPASLSSDEQAQWEQFCAQRLLDGGQSSRLAKYFSRINELAQGKLTSQQQYLLEELKLYGESIMPAEI